MTVKVFYLHTNKSKKALQKHLNDNKINYSMQDIGEKPLTWEEFISIVRMTDNGIDDLLPIEPNPQTARELRKIDFDTVTLKSFYNLVCNNPKLIRTPLIIKEDKMMVGFQFGSMCFLEDRHSKRANFKKLLKEIHEREKKELEAELGYSLV